MPAKAKQNHVVPPTAPAPTAPAPTPTTVTGVAFISQQNASIDGHHNGNHVEILLIVFNNLK